MKLFIAISKRWSFHTIWFPKSQGYTEGDDANNEPLFQIDHSQIFFAFVLMWKEAKRMLSNTKEDI